MKKTLSIDSLYIERNPNFLNELETALKLYDFDRCQFSLKSKNSNLLDNINKFIEIYDLSRQYCSNTIISIGCYQDYNNNNKDLATYEAIYKGSSMELKRICPSNKLFKQRIIELISDIYNRYLSEERGIIHLAYFRYENVNQCVCQTCIEDFKSYLANKNIIFNYNNYLSLLNQNIIAHWVHWRQDIIKDALISFSNSCNKNISIEIDFDETKRYLAGPKIEEGLYLPKLIPYLKEFYLHIEPLKSQAKFNFLGRKGQKDSYLNHLKYIISKCKQSDVKTHFFYWFLSNTEMIKTNLKEYIPLANAAKPEGIVFHTNKPFALATALAEGWL